MRCEQLSEDRLLRLTVRCCRRQRASPVEHRLRCQAELVQYRKVLRHAGHAHRGAELRRASRPTPNPEAAGER
jgi:hypothetical protein